MTTDRTTAEAACAAKILRLREFVAGGCRQVVPVDDQFEHFDIGMALVTDAGNHSEVSAIARASWHWERHVIGDRAHGPLHPMLDELQVWAALDGPGMPMHDVTARLDSRAIVEIGIDILERIGGRASDRSAA